MSVPHCKKPYETPNRLWTVSEWTADCFSHGAFSKHCILFYRFTIRQMIRQPTWLSATFMPRVLNRTNLSSIQMLVRKYPHVLIETHFAFHRDYFPPLWRYLVQRGKHGGMSIFWSTCLQTWQWTLKVIYSADRSSERLMFIFHPSMVFIIH